MDYAERNQMSPVPADDDLAELAADLNIQLCSTRSLVNEPCAQDSTREGELSLAQGESDCIEEIRKKDKHGQLHVTITNPSDAVQIGSNNVMYTYEGDTKPSKKLKKTVLKVPKRLINDDDMDQIARHLGRDWRHLGTKLGFLRGELDAFEYDHQRAGLHEVIYNMLLAWQERKGPDARIKVMVQQLINIKRPDVAKLLK